MRERGRGRRRQPRPPAAVVAACAESGRRVGGHGSPRVSLRAAPVLGTLCSPEAGWIGRGRGRSGGEEGARGGAAPAPATGEAAASAPAVVLETIKKAEDDDGALVSRRPVCPRPAPPHHQLRVILRPRRSTHLSFPPTHLSVHRLFAYMSLMELEVFVSVYNSICCFNNGFVWNGGMVAVLS